MIQIHEKLQQTLRDKVRQHNLGGEKVSVSCRDLSAEEAIGHPDDEDYPIIKGKERMMEAVFVGARGQAFLDEFGSREYQVNDLLELPLDSHRNRADFIAAVNAIFRYLGLCDHTIHCRDKEPPQCAAEALKKIGSGRRILLIGCKRSQGTESFRDQAGLRMTYTPRHPARSLRLPAKISGTL